MTPTLDDKLHVGKTVGAAKSDNRWESNRTSLGTVRHSDTKWKLTESRRAVCGNAHSGSTILSSRPLPCRQAVCNNTRSGFVRLARLSIRRSVRPQICSRGSWKRKRRANQGPGVRKGFPNRRCHFEKVLSSCVRERPHEAKRLIDGASRPTGTKGRKLGGLGHEALKCTLSRSCAWELRSEVPGWSEGAWELHQGWVVPWRVRVCAGPQASCRVLVTFRPHSVKTQGMPRPALGWICHCCCVPPAADISDAGGNSHRHWSGEPTGGGPGD